MKVWLVVFLIAFCGFLASCNKIATSADGGGPRKTLIAFLDACRSENYETAKGRVSAEDRPFWSDETCGFSVGNRDKMLATRYEILEVSRHGDTAEASVNLTLPDISSLFTKFMGQAFSTALGNKQADIKQEMSDLEAGDIPEITKTENFILIKESDGWRLRLGLKAKKLMAEADKLREQNRLHEAIAKYDQVLELDSEMVEAKEAIKKAKLGIQEHEKKQSYIANVELYDLRAGYYNHPTDGDNIPGVRFKIKNKGHRILRKVEVTVYFRDTDGKIIHEKAFEPVYNRPLSYLFPISTNKPLKPNYIWQMSHSFQFFKAYSVPSEWKEGAVVAKITDIEFSEEP